MALSASDVEACLGASLQCFTDVQLRVRSNMCGSADYHFDNDGGYWLYGFEIDSALQACFFACCGGCTLCITGHGACMRTWARVRWP